MARRGRESAFARQQREARENARMTVRCDLCPDWRYTGRAVTCVRKAQEHRARRHSHLPVQSPTLQDRQKMCKVEGCRAQRSGGGGRYAGLCMAHRAEAQQLATAEKQRAREARAAARPPRASRARQRVSGPSHAPRQPGCKVPGCTEPEVARRGLYAYLCAAHRPAPPARTPGTRRHGGPPHALAQPGRMQLVVQLFQGGIPVVGIAAAAAAAGWGGAAHLKELLGRELRAHGHAPVRGGGVYRIPDYNAREVANMFQDLLQSGPKED